MSWMRPEWHLLLLLALGTWSCGQPGVEPCASIKDDYACDAHDLCAWHGPETTIADDVDAVVQKEGCYRVCVLNDENAERECPEGIACVRASTALCGYGEAAMCLGWGALVVTLCDDPRFAPPP